MTVQGGWLPLCPIHHQPENTPNHNCVGGSVLVKSRFKQCDCTENKFQASQVGPRKHSCEREFQIERIGQGVIDKVGRNGNDGLYFPHSNWPSDLHTLASVHVSASAVLSCKIMLKYSQT